MQTIRWGIMGTGRIAELFAQGLQHVSNAEITGAASRNKNNADRFAARFGVPRTYESYEELAAAADIDVIYIATPNTLHRDNALLCLKHKKHILVEKPFAINAREASEIIDEARRQRCFCMEAMWMRFLPAMQKARQIVDSGILGDIRILTADFGLARPYDASDRVFNRELGGGSLLDLGVYPISLSWYLMGAAESAIGSASMTPTGVDEQASVILNYPGGAKAICTSSLNALTPHEAVINGTHGRLKIHAPIWRPSRLTVESFGAPVKPGDQTGSKGRLDDLKNNPLVGYAKQTFDGIVAPALNNLRRGTAVPYVGNGYNYEAIEVNRCVAAGETESPIMPMRETLQIMEVMDSVRKTWNLEYPADLIR